MAELTLPPTPPHYHEQESTGNGGLDWSVVGAAIVCALLCVLGLNTMLRCAFRCAARLLTNPLQWIASRRLNSGLKTNDMVALPTSTYSSSSQDPNNCAICLAEFRDDTSSSTPTLIRFTLYKFS
ncbi:hypothetical protein PIB30_019175 [Stylosanthes scabra]|uniref:Uncharacterized protein n=1 Tax=Stylosanthes scabra TaxID=79078 RepID=A0ABU6Z4R4_9FABA|nr:hypothetical protein [Stylosanthes scabra]